ncbi:MAG: hypothetical protein RJR35_05805 [Thermoanaerobacterales bacterium]|jgi:hypothetical protein|nr:hypothetical protein [Thermoanaerobacterales bacterium]
MKKRSFIPVVLMLVVCLLIMTSCADQTGENGGSSTTAEPVEIVLIDKDGNEKTVDLTKFESVTGEASFKKSTGAIVGPATLTGPKLVDVLDEIGGIKEGEAIAIVANDGYEMTLTYDQVMGQIMTYDEEGLALQVGGVEAIVAIESSDEGVLESPPRICFIGEGKPITDGHFWVKDIATIKIAESVKEWELSLSGIEEAKCDRSTFESAATCPDTTHPSQEWETTNKDGEKVVYKGVPLWVMVSMVDGYDTEDGHYRFNRDLSQKGYTVQVISADGYTVEFNSKDVAYNDGIFLAYLANDEPLDEDSGPLQLVGPNLPDKKHSVKQVKEIKLVNLPE